MKKFLSLFLVFALVSATLCGVTVFAEGETVYENVAVSADATEVDHWSGASFTLTSGELSRKAAFEGVLTSNAGYAFTVIATWSKSVQSITLNCIADTPITSAVVVYPASFTIDEVTYPIGAISRGTLAGTTTTADIANDSVEKIIVSQGIPKLSDYVFIRSTALKSLVLPQSITALNQYAIQDCTNLESVVMPGVTSTNKATFSGCAKLSDIDFSNLTSIGSYSFKGCVSIPSVLELDNLTAIGEHAFADCTSLTTVALPNVTSLAKNAVFSGCTSLVSFTGSAEVTAINTSFFSGCTSLTTVELPNLTSVGATAFYNCTSLVTLPNKLVSIGKSAFNKCTALETLDWSEVTAIGESSFTGCTALTSVPFVKLESMGKGAFQSCTNLVSVTFPATITSFGTGVFYGATALKDVIVEEDFVWPNNKIPSQTFRNCSSLAEFDIHKDVTSIDSLAFSSTALESVVIPVGVTTIGSESFANCKTLNKAVIKGTLTDILYRGFMNAPLADGIIFESGVAPTTIGGNGLNAKTAVVYYPANKPEFAESTVFGTKAVLPFGGHISAIADDGTNTTVTYSVADVYDNEALVATVALYDGDALVAVKSAVDVAGTEFTFENVTGADSAKIYVWNSLAGAKPLYESFEYAAAQ